MTHHLPCSHAHRLDREFAPTHIEQVLETGSQQVNDQNIVQTLLTEMVYLRDAHCSRWVSVRRTHNKACSRTHGIPLVCDTTGIHREVEELLPFWAPTETKYAASESEKEVEMKRFAQT